MNAILCIAALLTAFLGAFFFCRKKGAHKRGQCSEGACVPAEKEQKPSGEDLDAAYRLALDPCVSGMPVMYTLHTCLHCSHLKAFLEERGVEHKLVYVDDFEGDMRREAMSMVRHFNPRGTFPTLVLPDRRVVVGFRHSLVCEALGLNP